MKRNDLKLFLTTFFIILTTFLGVQHAFSKSCALPKSALLLLDKADAVFSGKVTNVKYLDDPERGSPEPRIIVTFDVYESWKGPLTKEITLHTVFNKWSGNGYFFSKDGEYLVFAYKRKNKKNIFSKLFGGPEEVYDVKLCNGTQFLNRAQTLIEQLDEGNKPE